MSLRRIPRPLLDSVVQHPEQIVLARSGRKAYQSLSDFGRGRVFLLRAIIDDSVTPMVVVTVYRTRKINKYWKEV